MEEFNKVKDEIVNTYLKDPNLHETKKEAISIQLKLSKNAYIDTLKSIEEPPIVSWIDIEKRKELLIDTLLGILSTLSNTITQICKFENLDLLQDINNSAVFCEENFDLFFETTFELINELQNFINSGFDEKHYYDEIKSLENKLKDIQKFSSTKITLDLIPKHPTDIIRAYIFDMNDLMKKDFNILSLINIINSHLKFRFEDNYKIIPMPTKKEQQDTLESMKKLAYKTYGKDFGDFILKDKKFIKQLFRDATVTLK